ncbi:MAG TPA: Ig-like domain-containing protein [Longimicrobiales bacterium]|nr:Ig-like domain-containing protein [Longimicrobiales bacterium]
MSGRIYSQCACSLVLCVSSLACSSTVEPVVPVQIEIVAGAGQTGPVYAALPGIIAVRALDADAEPVAGVEVRFTTHDGGGFEPFSAITDRAGIAHTSWTLGTSLGAQTALAVVVGASAVSAQIAATAVAGPPASIEISPDKMAVAEGVQYELQASVLDRFGHDASATPLQWSSSDTTIVTVDGTGRITGRSVGTAIVTATADGASGTATIMVVRPLSGTNR